MRSVIVILFFAIAFAPQSVSLKLDADGDQVIAIATHNKVILTDSNDCDDDYRNSHVASIFVTADTSQIVSPLLRLRESNQTRQIYDAKIPLYQLHVVLRI
jgi:hypothetical protein